MLLRILKQEKGYYGIKFTADSFLAPLDQATTWHRETSLAFFTLAHEYRCDLVNHQAVLLANHASCK
jgi:hypothetical protein